MEATERKQMKRWFLTDEEMIQLRDVEQKIGYLELCKRAKIFPATFYRVLKIKSARKKTIDNIKKVLVNFNNKTEGEAERPNGR